MRNLLIAAMATLVALALITDRPAFGHGDVAPQPVDVSELEALGEAWREENPYQHNDKVVAVGASAYNQNCARCHGLGAKSGGIAPDLRELPEDEEGDSWYIGRVRNGVVRNGVTYMPAFEGILPQEAMWAIRSWVETVPVD